jgi:hypothetical protein
VLHLLPEVSLCLLCRCQVLRLLLVVLLYLLQVVPLEAQLCTLPPLPLPRRCLQNHPSPTS